MEVIEYGICGLREVRIIKNENVIKYVECNDIDIAVSYDVQVRMPYLIVFHKWKTLATWGYLITNKRNEADINRDSIHAKMSAYALYTHMVKYGGF